MSTSHLLIITSRRNKGPQHKKSFSDDPEKLRDIRMKLVEDSDMPQESLPDLVTRFLDEFQPHQQAEEDQRDPQAALRRSLEDLLHQEEEEFLQQDTPQKSENPWKALALSALQLVKSQSSRNANKRGREKYSTPGIVISPETSPPPPVTLRVGTTTTIKMNKTPGHHRSTSSPIPTFPVEDLPDENSDPIKTSKIRRTRPSSPASPTGSPRDMSPRGHQKQRKERLDTKSKHPHKHRRSSSSDTRIKNKYLQVDPRPAFIPVPIDDLMLSEDDNELLFINHGYHSHSHTIHQLQKCPAPEPVHMLRGGGGYMDYYPR